eukprot:jgi/Mesvir1/826/Mv17409-RA.2
MLFGDNWQAQAREAKLRELEVQMASYMRASSADADMRGRSVDEMDKKLARIAEDTGHEGLEAMILTHVHNRTKDMAVDADTNVRKLREALEVVSQHLKDMQIQSKEIQNMKLEARRALDKMREDVSRARHEREQELQEEWEKVLSKVFVTKQRELHEEKKKRQAVEAEALAEERRMQEEMLQLQREREQEVPPEIQSRLDKLQECFDKIKMATGLTSAENVVERFLNRDELTASLQQTLEEDEKRLQRLRSKYKELEAAHSDLIHEGYDRRFRWTVFDQVEKKMQAAERRKQKALHTLEATHVVIHRAKMSIETMALSLGLNVQLSDPHLGIGSDGEPEGADNDDSDTRSSASASGPMSRVSTLSRAEGASLVLREGAQPFRVPSAGGSKSNNNASAVVAAYQDMSQLTLAPINTGATLAGENNNGSSPRNFNIDAAASGGGSDDSQGQRPTHFARRSSVNAALSASKMQRAASGRRKSRSATTEHRNLRKPVNLPLSPTLLMPINNLPDVLDTLSLVLESLYENVDPDHLDSHMDRLAMEEMAMRSGSLAPPLQLAKAAVDTISRNNDRVSATAVVPVIKDRITSAGHSIGVRHLPGDFPPDPSLVEESPRLERRKPSKTPSSTAVGDRAGDGLFAGKDGMLRRSTTAGIQRDSPRSHGSFAHQLTTQTSLIRHASLMSPTSHGPNGSMFGSPRSPLQGVTSPNTPLSPAAPGSHRGALPKPAHPAS